jgi:hypothetical protein
MICHSNDYKITTYTFDISTLRQAYFLLILKVQDFQATEILH